MEYTINNKYLVISQNRIQSRKYMVNKIIIGELTAETDKSFIFNTDTGKKRIWKKTISKLIDVSNLISYNERFLIEKIEGALI